MKDRYEQQELLVADFTKINDALKHLQVNSVISDIFLRQFVERFKTVKEPKMFFHLWEKIPYRSL